MKQKIIEFSQVLDTAANIAIPIEQISNSTKLSLDEAYAIQEKSIGLRFKRGEQLSGLKLGFTSKAKMEQMGVHDLIWGRLTNKMEIENDGDLYIKNFIHPRTEPEIAFLLKKDISEAITKANVAEYVKGVAAAIEVIDSRYKNFKFSLEDVIADNCSSSAYVLGKWKDFTIDSSNLAMTMNVNGKTVQSGNSNAILGNPLNSLLQAFRLAEQYNVPLLKDMVILAGAATPAVFVHENDTIVVEVEKLGKVSLKVK
ncbi:2-keto-4-pentenoate hydratase [Croceitalea sp. MTPC9]|uniref:2-keto-4-pentenoate hydratase n=1 Tax=unclassified Croceitalea TaxID=2632280 RepID=UPI002B3D0BC9|nr:2-keto-4-pentenoate hydratase [Croceitalea sp. MTPC6]GMN15289.1 2-keto-4-pentenoate hydratase [Croceitalea sp. MTPC9]